MPVRCKRHVKTAASEEGAANGLEVRRRLRYSRRVTKDAFEDIDFVDDDMLLFFFYVLGMVSKDTTILQVMKAFVEIPNIDLGCVCSPNRLQTNEHGSFKDCCATLDILPLVRVV